MEGGPRSGGVDARARGGQAARVALAAESLGAPYAWAYEEEPWRGGARAGGGVGRGGRASSCAHPGHGVLLVLGL